MNTVSLPVPYHEVSYTERLPARPESRAVAPAARATAPLHSHFRAQSGAGRRWTGAVPGQEQSGAGISAYASVSRMGVYYKGMIVDCRV